MSSVCTFALQRVGCHLRKCRFRMYTQWYIFRRIPSEAAMLSNPSPLLAGSSVGPTCSRHPRHLRGLACWSSVSVATRGLSLRTFSAFRAGL